MAKNIKNIDELKSEISKTEKQIKASDLKIESLREEKQKKEYQERNHVMNFYLEKVLKK